jgi:predicted aspartyl protease
VEAGVFLAYFKLMYREVDISDSRNGVPELMLGITVFEGLGIRIDPATGELEYSKLYGLSAI